MKRPLELDLLSANWKLKDLQESMKFILADPICDQ